MGVFVGPLLPYRYHYVCNWYSLSKNVPPELLLFASLFFGTKLPVGSNMNLVHAAFMFDLGLFIRVLSPFLKAHNENLRFVQNI